MTAPLGLWKVTGQMGFTTRETLARKYVVAAGKKDIAWTDSIENARLVAAAPKMLDALRTIIDSPDIICKSPGHGGDDCPFDLVRAAIAEATGGA